MKRITYFIFALVLVTVLPSLGQVTESQIRQRINLNIPTNGTKQITATKLREVLNEMTDYTAWVDSTLTGTLPIFVTKAGTDTITGPKTFIEPTTFTGDVVVKSNVNPAYFSTNKGHALEFDGIQYPYILNSKINGGFFIQTFDWNNDPYQFTFSPGGRFLAPRGQFGPAAMAADSAFTLYAGGDSKINGNLTVTGQLLGSGTGVFARKDTLVNFAPLTSPTFTGTVSGITKGMVGLGSVDNTSDAGKPISTATQAALDLKVNTAALTSTYARKDTLANFGRLAGANTWSGSNTVTGTLTLSNILYLPSVPNGFQQASGFVLSPGVTPTFRPHGVNRYDFATNNSTPVLSVHTDGNASFGSTANSGEKLQVTGTSKFTGLSNFQGGVKHSSTSFGIDIHRLANETNYEKASIRWVGSDFVIGTTFGAGGATRGAKFGVSATADLPENRTLNVQSSTPFFSYTWGSTGLPGSTVDIGGGNSFVSSNSKQIALSITPTINQTGTASYNGILGSVYEQSLGSGEKLLFDFGTNNGAGTHTSKFKVDNTGKSTQTGAVELTTAGEGIILKTPDGTKRYKITIDNSGNLITTLL